jgi:hypothetical protein
MIRPSSGFALRFYPLYDGPWQGAARCTIRRWAASRLKSSKSGLREARSTKTRSRNAVAYSAMMDELVKAAATIERPLVF